MGKVLDIAFPIGGVIITLFRFFQIGILTDNNFIDFNISVYKLGIHLHLVYEEDNRCREIE